MKPVIDDRDELVNVGEEALESVHDLTRVTSDE
jgi:hypothetical protein